MEAVNLFFTKSDNDFLESLILYNIFLINKYAETILWHTYLCGLYRSTFAKILTMSTGTIHLMKITNICWKECCLLWYQPCVVLIESSQRLSRFNILHGWKGWPAKDQVLPIFGTCNMNDLGMYLFVSGISNC